MINIFVFTLQTLITYLIGRSVYLMTVRIFKQKLSDLKILKIEPNNFYLLFGLFAIGNISFIFNFFGGINQIAFYIILIFIIIYNFKQLNFPSFNFQNMFVKLSIFGVFIISTYNAGLSKDSDTYHLNNQLFIRDESIIFGLSNLHHRYGFSSLWEYIGANYWIHDNFVFLQTPSLLIFVSFYIFLYSFLISKDMKYKKISLIILFFGLIDNFGFQGGRNGFVGIDEIGAFDNTFGLLFIISIIFLINLLIDDSPSNLDIFVVGLLILFSGQVRYLGFLLTIPYLLLIFKNKLNSSDFRKIFSIGFLLSALWFLKNLIISSCLIYPINITCLSSLKWHQESQAIVVNKSIRGHPRHPNDIFSSLNDFKWVSDPWLPNNSDYLLNFIFSLLIVKLIFFVKPSKKSIKYYIFSFTFFVIWFVLTPAYRYATPIFLSILILINLDYIKSDKRPLIFFKSKFLVYPLFVICLILTVRVDSYKTFISNPFNSINIAPNTIEYVSRNNFYGLKPQDGKVCFLKKDCFPDEYEVTVDRFLNYKIIIPENPNYWNEFLLNIQNKKSI